MENVFEGTVLRVDWMTKLETSIMIGYTLPNGKQLLQMRPLTPVVVQSSFEAIWSFPMFQPFTERFDPFMPAFVEAGLVEEWRYRTRKMLKKKFAKPGSAERLMKRMKSEERGIKIELITLSGPFFLLATFFSFSIVLLLVEKFAFFMPKKTAISTVNQGGINSVIEIEYNPEMFTADDDTHK